ncbi:MAG: hypothetical protein ACOC05_02715, partial [Oceanicaulis sp.]
MRRSLTLTLGLAAAGLSACATPPEPDGATPAPQAGEIFYNPVERENPGEAGRVTRMLAGAWSNAEQYALAPDDMKRPPAPGRPYDWIDLQYAEFHTVDAPRVGDHVVYLEWRSGAAHGEISRQRIWAFREDEAGSLTGMDFYTFADPGPYAGRGAEAGAFTALSEDDLIAYPDGCTLQARALDAGGFALG